MTVSIYLASEDVRHLAVLTQPITADTGGWHGPGSQWVAICGRASRDSRFVHVDTVDATASSPTVRITKPICHWCSDALTRLHAAAELYPAPPPRPLPTITGKAH